MVHRKLLIFSHLFFLFFYLFLFYPKIQNLEYLEFGDNGIFGIKIENAKLLKEKTGANSRMNFNHPGPIVYYIYAFTEKIFNFFKFTPFTYYLLSQFFLNFFLIWFINLLFWKIFNDFKKLILFDLLLFIFFENLNQNADYSFLYEIWLPVVTIIPFVYVILYLIYILENQKIDYYMVIASFSLGIMVSNHLSSVSFAAFPLFLGFVYLFYKKNLKFNFNERVWLLISFLTIFLIFLLPIIEQIQNGKDGNIYKILQVSLQTSSLRKGKDVFIYFFELWSLFFTSKIQMWGGIIIFSIVHFFIILWKNKYPLYKKIYFLLNLLTLITLVYIFKIPFDLLHYLSWFYIAIFIFYIFLVLVIFIDKFQLNQKTILILSILFIVLNVQIFRIRNRVVDKNHRELQIEREFLKKFSFENDIQYKIVWGFQNEDHKLWPLGIGLVYELYKRKIHICVDENWLFMAGKEFKCNNKMIKEIIITQNEPVNFDSNNKKLFLHGVYIYEK